MIKLILFLCMFTVISLLLHKYGMRITNKNHLIKNSEAERIKLKAIDIIMIFVIALLPSIIVGFRAYDVGTDTLSYIRYFNYNEMQFDAFTSNEFLFWEFFKFTKFLFNNISLTFFIIAFFTYGLSFTAIIQLAKKEHVGIVTFLYLCLFYQEGFNIMRQMLALSIIMISIPYIIDRKQIKYFLLVIIASFFHTSALICIPMYWIYQNKKISIIKYTTRISLLFLIIVFFDNIFFSIVKYDMFERFSIYQNQFIYNSLWWTDVLIFIPFFLILLFMHRNIKLNKNSTSELPSYEFYLFLVIIYIVVLSLRMYINWVFRFGYYFQIGMLFYFGLYFKNHYNKYRSYLKIVTLICFISYYFFLNYYTNFDSSALVNYKWFK